MAAQPIVTVAEGQLKGNIAADSNGGQYFSFQGIPYAKPPVGALRFQAPQPAEPWSGVRNATSEGSACYSRHMIFQHIIGSEDCLFLNVYTKQLPSSNVAFKPVMVWIHGGGFTSGSGNSELYGPDFLLAQDVVLVTINYRVGLLGFLSLEDPSLEIPGNAGLKDQVLALKWVQKNIAQFNGDPNNVTIFGESAGAASVHYQILSPMAKGLFHKAIVQSGSAIACWAGAQRSASLVAKALELNTSDEKEILKILEEAPVEKVFEIQEKIPDEFVVSEVRPYGPVVEKPSKEPAFLSEKPIDLITSGRYNKVPLLIGYTTREGMLSEIITKTKYGEVVLVTDFEKAVPYTMNLPKGSDISKKVAQQIQNFYYGDEKPDLSNIDQYYLVSKRQSISKAVLEDIYLFLLENLPSAFDYVLKRNLQSDNFFLRAIYATLKLQSVTSLTPIYFYRMSVESKLNVFKIVSQVTKPGTCHADDLGYLFRNAMTPAIRPGSIEEDASNRFTKLWTNFARTGNPNPANKDPLINVTWKPV